MVTVVIPTYQERENIAQTVDEILRLPIDCQVIVVDDASTDGTKEVLYEIEAKQGARVQIIHRASPRSFAGSYIQGFTAALANPNCHAVIECDADGSHPVNSIPDLVQALHQADIVIGSRYIPGGNIAGFSRDRLLLSSAANLYLRWATKIRARDITAGFVAYRRDILEKIPFAQIASNGYAFQIEMKQLIQKAEGRMHEIPITFIDRSKGQSKMSFHTMIEAFLLGLRYRFRRS